MRRGKENKMIVIREEVVTNIEFSSRFWEGIYFHPENNLYGYHPPTRSIWSFVLRPTMIAITGYSVPMRTKTGRMAPRSQRVFIEECLMNPKGRKCNESKEYKISTKPEVPQLD